MSGGLNTALPGVLMRSQSASAMLQHQLAPLAARQAAAMLNKVREARESRRSSKPYIRASCGAALRSAEDDDDSSTGDIVHCYGVDDPQFAWCRLALAT